MSTPADFGCRALREDPAGPAVARILSAALRAADPASAVLRFASRTSDRLLLGHHVVPLARGRVFVLAVGKAAPVMASAFVPLVGDRLAGGLIVAPFPVADSQPDLPVIVGGHPLPDEGSLQAGAAVRALLRRLAADDLLVCLISGGGSALLVDPPPGLSLSDLRALTESLLACGAPIEEVNLVRRNLDDLKGGGLVRLAAPARVIGLILSDVPGDRLDVVASGLTTPMRPVPVRALDVLARYGLLAHAPPSVLEHLRAAAAEQAPVATPDALNVVIGNNALACEAALDQARQEGFIAQRLPPLSGEARATGMDLAARLLALSPGVCAVTGGETTVTLRGNGRGGRNQELALAAAIALDGSPDVLLAALATDGRDGPTDSAGAVVTGHTLSRARQLGLDAAACLERNDSFSFFEALGDHLVTGPTGTNVNDLVLLLRR